MARLTMRQSPYPSLGGEGAEGGDGGGGSTREVSCPRLRRGDRATGWEGRGGGGEHIFVNVGLLALCLVFVCSYYSLRIRVRMLL